MKVVQPIREKEVLIEFLEYLKEKNYRNYLLAMLGMNTGLRISDILKLQVKHVRGSHIEIKENKKKKNNRTKINRDLRRALKPYIEGKEDDEYLFVSKKKKKIGSTSIYQPIKRETAYAILKDAANYVGLENIGTHTLRKTFGFMLYQKTKDINIVMDFLNHDSEAYTKRYIGYSQSQRDKLIDDFSVF